MTGTNQELRRQQTRHHAEIFHNMASLEHWLHIQIERHNPDLQENMIVDVGAYHGDFSQCMFANFHFARAIFFELHPDNFTLL